MTSFLQSLRPSFRRAKAQGALIADINRALDDGRTVVAAHGVRRLIADYGKMPSTVSVVDAVIDRVEHGIEHKEHPAPGVHKDRLSRAYELERAAQEKFDKSDFGQWLHQLFGSRESKATPLDMMLRDVCNGVSELAVRNMRDKAVAPVVEQLLDRVVRTGPEYALHTAEQLADLASPHWLGFLIPEDMPLTNRYKATQPLKHAAVKELMAVADAAEAKGNFRLAFTAAAAAEKVTWNTPGWQDIHQAALAKREAVKSRWFSGMSY